MFFTWWQRKLAARVLFAAREIIKFSSKFTTSFRKL